ncbi:MAG: hypothetical protein KGI11_09075 [Thaumarchaeota archaeon]|nr:hypothetical protein [Nitrososphaerota archaeon]
MARNFIVSQSPTTLVIPNCGLLVTQKGGAKINYSKNSSSQATLTINGYFFEADDLRELANFCTAYADYLEE